MSEKKFITMDEVSDEAARIAFDLPARSRVWGIPRGGVAAALAVYAASIKLRQMASCEIVNNPEQATILIDDIYDSGETARRFTKKHDKPVQVLFDKRDKRFKGRWLVMPWEMADKEADGAADIIIRLLQFIGEDPKREGLVETPARVLKAWQERTNGYRVDPTSILKCFEEGAENVDELVIVHNIPVVSVCEHHMADIIGIAHVGYIPDNRIVGLSKLARLVEIFARRLQVQERLTTQIADALVTHLKPLGVGVLIRASHACMSTRGVKIHGSVTTTSAMRGALLDKGTARKEFIDLCMMAERKD